MHTLSIILQELTTHKTNSSREKLVGMTDMSDEDEKSLPLWSSLSSTFSNDPHSRLAVNAQTAQWINHINEMQLHIQTFQWLYPMQWQQEYRGMAANGRDPPGLLYTEPYLTIPVPSLAIPLNITTSDTPPSGILNIPPTLACMSRSSVYFPPLGNKLQLKSPAKVKQDISTCGPSTSHIDPQLHEPVQEATLPRTPTAYRLSPEAKPNQDVHATVEIYCMKTSLNLKGCSALKGQQNLSEVECDNANSHSLLDPHPKIEKCSQPVTAEAEWESFLNTELRKSVIVTPELHQDGPCYSQETCSYACTSPQELLDMSRNQSNSRDSRLEPVSQPERIATSKAVEAFFKDCLKAGDPVLHVDLDVKLPVEEVKCMPERDLDNFPVVLAAEIMESNQMEMLESVKLQPLDKPTKQKKLPSKSHTMPKPPYSARVLTSDVSNLLECEHSSNNPPKFSETKPQSTTQQVDFPKETADNIDCRVQSPTDNKCPICGDNVSGYHYGIYSCESCKGFFKRTIHSKRFEKLKCSVGGICIVNLKNRKQCASCRFHKCLSLGMKLEAIRSDRQRGGRSLYNGSAEQRRLKKLEEEKIQEMKATHAKKRKQKRVSGCLYKVKRSDTTNLESSNEASSESDAKTVLMASPCKREMQQDHPKLQTKPQLKAQPASLPRIIQILLDKEKDFSQQNISECCLNILHKEKNLLVTLSHIVNHKMIPLIRWARGLPLYGELMIEDQISLLHSSVLSILCLNLIFYCLDEAGHLLMPQNRVIDLTYFSAARFNQLVPKITNIGHQIHTCGIDMKRFVCLKLILLLNPDSPSLQNYEQVRSYQESIQSTFFAYMSQDLPKNKRIAGNLMLSLAAIERVTQQVTQETICSLDVVSQMFRDSGDNVPDRQWIRCRFI